MIDWAKEIYDRLEKYAGYEIENFDDGLSVLCSKEGSFEVSIHRLDEDCYLVGFDGWHEQFDRIEPALNCFSFGFSDQCRLKVRIRGRMECAWTVQSKEADIWEDDSTTGLLLVPFWKRSKTVFRQNTLDLRR